MLTKDENFKIIVAHLTDSLKAESFHIVRTTLISFILWWRLTTKTRITLMEEEVHCTSLFQTKQTQFLISQLYIIQKSCK